MPVYKVHAPGEDRDEALVCEFATEEQAAEWYAEQLRAADRERLAGYAWRTEYDVFVRVPGGPRRTLRVVFPASRTLVMEV